MIQSCKQCCFYDEAEADWGLCRRYAPRPAVVGEDEGALDDTVWPPVCASDCCGEGTEQ
jgi:hypothetical protein